MLYRHKLPLHCVPQRFEHEYTRATNVWLYQVETALLVDWSDSDRCLAAIAWASCCLFSLEQCLAAFAWASCCLLFIIISGTSDSTFPEDTIYLNTITIFFSVWQLYLFLACETLCLLFSETWVWAYSWGYLHFHFSFDEHAVSESAYSCINSYRYLYLHRSLDEHAMTESANARMFARTNCWPY